MLICNPNSKHSDFFQNHIKTGVILYAENNSDYRTASVTSVTSLKATLSLCEAGGYL